jgi:hypothetical protein
MDTLYDDYKFVTRKELQDLGLDHLMGMRSSEFSTVYKVTEYVENLNTYEVEIWQRHYQIALVPGPLVLPSTGYKSFSCG